MSDSVMERMWQSGHISAGNASYVEELYEKYLEDPSDIPDQWRSYFETLPLVEGTNAPDISHSTVQDHFLLLAKNQARVVPVSAASINAGRCTTARAIPTLCCSPPDNAIGLTFSLFNKLTLSSAACTRLRISW